MNPKEQVQAMLEKAKLLTEERKQKEEAEKERILVQTIDTVEEPVVNLPSLYSPVSSLSLVEDATETRETIISKFSIDPENYKSIKLTEDATKRIKKAVGRMTTGASASVPINAAFESNECASSAAFICSFVLFIVNPHLFIPGYLGASTSSLVLKSLALGFPANRLSAT